MKRILTLVFLLCLAAAAQTPAQTEFKTLVEGYGPEAAFGDTIDLTYELRLPNGEVMDVSTKPFRFVPGGDEVFRGLSLGVVGARRGETRLLIIPPADGYGDRQVGPIPPNSTLHLTIKVLKVTKGIDHDHDNDGKQDHEPHEHDDQDHDHDGDGEQDHADDEHYGHGHAHQHRPEDYENHSGANLNRPAIFEYLIRDFFTRPWRYADATAKVWKANAGLMFVVLAAWLLAAALERRERRKS